MTTYYKYKFKYKFTSQEQFSSVVSYINRSAGKGSRHWNINGAIRKYITRNIPVERTISFRDEKVGKEIEFFLSLMK